jgi:hypothetical protein
VEVNGEPVEDVTPGTFLRIERLWKEGDTVQLRFPMTPKTSRWINDSVAVTRGPLVFSLLMEEERTSTQSFLDGKFHTYEIRPARAWNYALLLDDGNQPEIETTVSDSMPEQPFRAADAPVRLTVKAVQTDQEGWGSYREDFPARAVEPPSSPVKVSGDIQDIQLVPYGATEIRITQFPWAEK